ncbi:hypothetical protein Lepto7376_2217 [[Leptolyngbya] sp. PCC 7376]|uniref:PTPA-CTERM sorting domain-containing protein n=1 Tax=[Leptolyngbya] sp. PCC 7376 TaxID=111781 RepID=UPI00029F0171|nr:PTPA-CTERM sorting domain-containing protein [[Leptolyngbya] sp. PCC 7376]AFY38507.1 hypothetical protein Lepto7376_2217 [[Leptolyngbya] sp. PCC 7376]
MMNRFGLSILTLASVVALAPTANAFDIKGWNYSVDSDNDSTSINGVGGTEFEIYGSAVQQHDGKTRFAARTKMPLDGVLREAAEGGRISWGDLIINIACDALDQVGRESLFGIRFAANNESGVSGLGVYGDIELMENAQGNNNHTASLAEHNEYVIGEGGSPQTGTLPISYFDESTHVPSLIKSGTFLGAVEIIEDTSSWGLEGFDRLGGHTIALQWDYNLIPTQQGQEVCYHLTPECNNDIQGGTYTTAVPTPAAVLPVLSGLFAAAKRKGKKEALS